jgi:hypothetical protein
MARRLKKWQHARHPWRISEIAPDFELIDAWALPARGTREEFADLCEIFATFGDAPGDGSGLAGALFALRTWLGEKLGWDRETNALPIPGCDETSLRQRLPPDLARATDDTTSGSPFRLVYQTGDEFAAELSNSTVHAIVHLGWVTTGDIYRGQMGIYVKPRGRFGRVYMAAIAPFRYWIVYPALLRRIGRAWKARP